MKTVHGLEAFDPPPRRPVLTVGNFDGVHRAHQQLLAQAGLFAANTGGPVVVLTFEPHPLTIVSPERAPARISTPTDKLGWLAEAGADITIVAKSNPALFALEARQFVEEVIVRRFHPTHIVEGPSFGFGRGRTGNAELLKQLSCDLDFEVHIVEPVTVQIDEGETCLVSSSLIRRLILEGKVRRASLCLGRCHALTGTVVEGDRRGRTIGFPTANLAGAEQLVPGDSVYAGRATVGTATHLAAISIGTNPTFGGKGRRIEAHLLDFDGDLYGQPIRLEFVRRLRRPEAFESPEHLVRQLIRDVEAVRNGATEPAEKVERS